MLSFCFSILVHYCIHVFVLHVHVYSCCLQATYVCVIVSMCGNSNQIHFYQYRIQPQSTVMSSLSHHLICQLYQQQTLPYQPPLVVLCSAVMVMMSLVTGPPPVTKREREEREEGERTGSLSDPHITPHSYRSGNGGPHTMRRTGWLNLSLFLTLSTVMTLLDFFILQQCPSASCH